MKDFTTPEHITPIIDEITSNFYPVTDPKVCAALHCAVLMQARKSRAAYAIRPGEPFYIFNAAMSALYKTIHEYSAAAETYPGELDRWTYDEEQRAQHATRDALLQLYA